MRMPAVVLVVAAAVFLPAAGSQGQDRASSTPQFSHPLAVTNPYLPLASLKQDILEGTEKGKPLRVERTVKPGSKTFSINGQNVEALIVEDREFINGRIEEVTLDYFAQDDDGNVYYLGEDVDNYKDGKVVSHEGAWLYGKDTQKLGLIMPAHPRVGQKFRSEDVGKVTVEKDTVVSLSEKATVPAGKFEHVLMIKETNSDGETEEKLYALGVGAIKEEDLLLKSHNQ
jgi:hypothetical protein